MGLSSWRPSTRETVKVQTLTRTVNPTRKILPISTSSRRRRYKKSILIIFDVCSRLLIANHMLFTNVSFRFLLYPAPQHHSELFSSLSFSTNILFLSDTPSPRILGPETLSSRTKLETLTVRSLISPFPQVTTSGSALFLSLICSISFSVSGFP